MYSENLRRLRQDNGKLYGESGNLDFLRSTAVLFVVFFHVLLVYRSTPWNLWGIGHWGVLIFFVHTSLVLMYSLKRQRAASFGDGYRDFLLRRCFRIYPLSIAAVLLIFFLRLPVGHLEAGGFVAVPIDAAVLTSNLVLVQNLTGSESIMATLWSLPYEMQMYLVLPLLFLVANTKSGIYALLGGFALAALMGAMLPEAQWNGWEMPRYVPCFLAGVIAYRFSLDQRPVLPGWMWPVFIAAITLAYLAKPGIKTGWVCCLVLALAIPCFAELRRGMLTRLCQIIAQYSYGIYLTHFICLWISFEVFALAPMWLRLISFILLLAGASFAAYHAIELPFIRLGKRLTARQPAMRITVLASVQPD
jgi:peptidoglycan/LPS O-acetylase OafA/YrhL